jgi:hypothetical protein
MSDNDSDDLGIPRRGVVPAYGHRGWQGEELELAHATKPAAAKDGAAVDFSQFRNEEVGKGYQAKFVVRQPSAGEASKVTVHDLSTKTDKKLSKKASKKERKDKPSAKKANRVDKYLGSKALREFRKELEKF